MLKPRHLIGSAEWLQQFTTDHGLYARKARSDGAPKAAPLPPEMKEIINLRADLDEAARIVFELSREIDQKITIISGLENKLAALSAECRRLRATLPKQEELFPKGNGTP